jgi:hypothetical protein
LSNLFCLCNKCHAKVERETTRFGAP